MSSPSGRVLLVELDGASYEGLGPLAARGVMPQMARLLESAALIEPQAVPGLSDRAARATFWTGFPPSEHGMLDDWRFDAARRRLVPGRIDRLARPTLWQAVQAAFGPAAAARLEDFDAASLPWQEAPKDLASLERRVASTRLALQALADRAADVDRDWRFLTVRVRTLAGLQCHLASALPSGDRPGANPRWVAAVERLMQSVDACLGQLVETAHRRKAAVVVASPSGVVPLRGRITLSELFLRAGLLQLCRGPASLGYHAGRLGERARRWFASGDGAARSARSVVPVDWRRTSVVAIHGHSAALVYLNTPERFGGHVLATASARDRAARAAVEALSAARDPTTGEPLFIDAFCTEDRYGTSIRRHGWPEVIGIPATGFTTRHRPDRQERLVRPTRGQTTTTGGPGLLVIDSPWISPGEHRACSLEEAAPLIAELLGLRPTSPRPTVYTPPRSTTRK
ncbi:MAG: alkaline phosphatase family protein [Pirellulales bacterium]|nr:alkaline phosphatase family protein [Pirellulales bacterium]